MKIAFSEPSSPRAGAVGVLEGGTLLRAADALDKKTGGAVTLAIAASRLRGVLIFEESRWAGWRAEDF